MRGTRGRLPTLLALALGLAALGAVAAAWLGLGGPEAPPPPASPRAEAPAPSSGPPAASSPEAESGRAPPAAGGRSTPSEGEGLGGLGSRAAAWDQVDLEAVREAMPNNRYWKLAVPTDDAALLREREEFRARLNEQYGKVQSNTATESEVRDYYEQRRRISADYVEFTTHLLEHYREAIPERDVGLLELARELHLARLEEIPQKLSRALERREEHLEARRDWRAQQRRFAGEEPEAAEPGDPPAGADAPPSGGGELPAAPDRSQ